MLQRLYDEAQCVVSCGHTFEKQCNRLGTLNNSVSCRVEHNIRVEACKNAVTCELKQIN
jgi:hypothetical protein